MSRSWIAVLIAVVLFVLLPVLVIKLYGECLTNTPWGNVAINVISDLFFVIALAVVFGPLHLVRTRRARKFFGVGHQDPIQVFISTHKDETTSTGKALTAEEYEVADELGRILKRQFAGFIPSLARLFGIDLGALDVLDIVIKGSPLEANGWPYSGSLLLVGGPTRNKLTERFQLGSDPWTFDDGKKRFIERKQGEQAVIELEDSHRLAILKRRVDDDRVIIIAFGYGEIETAAAVRYLAQNWKSLAKKRGEFAQLLRVDGLAQVQVFQQYPEWL